MGLTVTLFLISFNVYNSVEAPPNRGLSYVDIWMLGMCFPILMAIVEYSIILGRQKLKRGKTVLQFKWLHHATENVHTSLPVYIYQEQPDAKGMMTEMEKVVWKKKKGK